MRAVSLFVFVIALVLSVSQLALAESTGVSGFYNFTLVVDRSAPKKVEGTSFVSWSKFQTAVKEDKEENPGPILYKVVYGKSWEDAEKKCDWPDQEELLDINSLKDDGWEYMCGWGSSGCEGISEDLKNYALSIPESHSLLSPENQNNKDHPVKMSSVEGLMARTTEYPNPYAYVVVCVMAFDKTLKVENAKKYYLKFTNPQNCIYDVYVEVWNPWDRHDWITNNNDHTRCARDWKRGKYMHHHFNARGGCRTFRDDACGRTSENGGTGAMLLGFYLNPSYNDFAGDVKFGYNTYDFNVSSAQIPSFIPNVVAFDWGLSAEDESEYSLRKYAGILIEKWGLVKTAVNFRTDNSQSVTNLAWARDPDCNPWIKMPDEGLHTIYGGVLAAPRYAGGLGKQNWGKDSIQYGVFRFYLANASKVRSLDGAEINLKCNDILDILSLMGDDNADDYDYASVAGPAGVYACFGMTNEYGEVEDKDVCKLVKDKLCRAHKKAESCKKPASIANYYYNWADGVSKPC